jgi:hypothetical protein
MNDDIDRMKLELALSETQRSTTEVFLTHGEAAVEEHICRSVLRLMQEGKDTIEIAERMGMTYNKVVTYKRKSRKLVERQIHSLDPAWAIGEVMSFTNRVKEEALNIATDEANRSFKIKVEALNAALKASELGLKSLSVGGFFEAKPLVNKDKDDDNIRKGSMLGDIAMQLMRGEKTESDNDGEIKEDIELL